MTQKILLSLLFFMLSINLHSQETDKSNYALLWEISGNGLETPSYLFGTMHIRDPRAFEFSDSVLINLDNCEAFATEVHPDSMIFFFWDLTFNADTTNFMRKVLSAEAYEKLDESMRRKTGLPIDSMRLKDPRSIDNVLNDWDEPETENSKDLFLDMYLHKIAKQQGKPIFGVEQPIDQFTARESILIEEFEAMAAEDSVDIAEVLAFTFKDKIKKSDSDWSWDEFVETYRRGDLETIEKLTQKNPFRNPKEDEALIIRNRIMATNFEKICRKRSLFCAVGAAHLPGEEGVVQLLKNQGFTVRKVSPVFTGLAEKYVEKKVKLDWHKMEGETTNFAINLPSKPYRVKEKKVTSSLISEVYIYLDAMTQNSYMVGNLYFPFIGSKFNIDTLYLEEFKAFSFKNNFEDSAEKKAIKHSGFEGWEFSGRRTEKIFVKAWYFLINNQRMVFQVEYPNNEDAERDVERFFKSLYIEPVEMPNWHQFKNEIGAFALQVPAEPKHQLLETPVEMDDGKVETFKLDVWISKDLEDGNVYFFRYNDLVPGRVIDEDSVYFAALLEDYTNKGMEILKESTVFLDGYEGRDMVLSINGLYMRIRYFLRGHRTYLLMQQLPLGKKKPDFNHAFFESFHFLPFQESVLEQVEYPEFGFSGVFPSKVFSEHDTLGGYSFPTQITHTFYALDDKTGTSYLMNQNVLSPYFQVSNVDTFFTEYYGAEDSTLFNEIVQIDTIWNGRPARFYRLDTKSSLTDLYYFLILDKGLLYELYAYLPKEMKEDNEFWAFINQLKLADDYAKGDIFSSKKDLIFEDLLSEDSLTVVYAKNGLNYYEFDKEDLPDIYKMMSIDLPYDTLVYNSVFKTLVRELPEFANDSTFLFLTDLFYKKSARPNHQISILEAMQELEHPNSLDTFFTLIPKVERTENSYFPAWNLVAPFRDSFEVFQDYYPELLTMMHDTLFEYQILSMVHTFVNTDTLDVKFIENDKNLFFEMAQKMAAKNALFEMDTFQYFDDAWTLQYLIEIIVKLNPDDKVLPFYEKLSKLNFAIYSPAALSFLLKKGKKIPKSMYQKLAKDEIGWVDFLKYFQREKQLSAIPKKLHNQEKVAFGHLKYYMEDDYGYGEIISYQLLEVFEKSDEKNALNLYVYSFKMQDDPTNYLGFVGQPRDKTAYTFYNGYFNFIEDYDPEKPLEEQMETLTQYYEFE